MFKVRNLAVACLVITALTVPAIGTAAAQSSNEPDPKKREALVKAALREQKEQVTTLPLHRQVIPWAARANVSVVHRADNWLEVPWVTVARPQ